MPLLLWTSNEIANSCLFNTTYFFFLTIFFLLWWVSVAVFGLLSSCSPWALEHSVVATQELSSPVACRVLFL